MRIIHEAALPFDLSHTVFIQHKHYAAVSVYGIRPNISNRVGVNAARCKRAVRINSFKRSAFVYPHRNKLYRWRYLLPLDEEILRAYAIDGHNGGAAIYRMNPITQTAACACHLKSSSPSATPAPAIFRTP